MVDPNEFKQSTKISLARRAGYKCSICDCLTVGPSDEADNAVTMIGQAAHIHGARPAGTARYLATMTPAERSSIDNGIWLCANHAKAIDDDEVAYTPARLREIRKNHLAKIKSEVGGASRDLPGGVDLLALGPEVICLGEVLEIDGRNWKARIDQFVVGDFGTLIKFSEGFENTPTRDRYVLANALGDGRALSSPITVSKIQSGFTVTCPVIPHYPRIEAAKLGSQLAVGPDGDVYAEKGRISRVSGIASLKQSVGQLLSLRLGESIFDPYWGARLAEYRERFSSNPWLQHFFKLEVIRLASIPLESTGGRIHTPLQCVEKVRAVEIRLQPTKPNWYPATLELDIQGIGYWKVSLDICLPPESSMRYAEEIRQALAGHSLTLP